MTVRFEKNGKTFEGAVTARGFFNVDADECFQIELADRPHLTLTVPVADCTEI